QISYHIKQQKVCEISNNSLTSKQEVSATAEDSHTTEQSSTSNIASSHKIKQCEEKQRQRPKQGRRVKQASASGVLNKKAEGPYNVIMTPRDKRNLLLNKQEKKSGKTIDN